MQGMTFNACGVEGILAGRKTQTRRPMKVQPMPELSLGSWDDRGADFDQYLANGDILRTVCKPRYRLGPCYMKETWYLVPCSPGPLVFYRQDFNIAVNIRRWRPSIYMPEWATRCILDITHIWPEQVQDISEEDAIKEGADNKADFAARWEQIYHDTPNAWERNPWNFAYEIPVKEKR